ncbi:conserved hypothetical protein [Leptospira interrogans serovar Manilae]|uniref:Uncharacterized protein n=1 Tax=Leptospira interrogans serovar Manilae TaxID=214675 RepID=A0AAQ1NYN0_LEPIR|nr:hypothetical protein [Leptospira interrogans]SOR62270.1 conserved hypothetical protein [Leptospira interrogans serovar Manilae]SOR63239.1 conserved hypothetical protein [Leptospira interrogans serovar Manilae]
MNHGFLYAETHVEFMRLTVGIGKFVGTTTFFKNTDLFYYSDA